MPRDIIKHRHIGPPNLGPERLRTFGEWLHTEIQDAISARAALEADWREDLRQYEALPRQAVRNFPIENAPNVEIPIGAIATDNIAAQAVDLIFGISPLVTVRPVPDRSGEKNAVEKAKAVQRWVNWMATSEVRLRQPGEEFILDDVQLGTGIFYVPWTKRRKKTKTSTLVSFGPRIICYPPEHVIVTAGSGTSLDEIPVLALRNFFTQGQLAARAAENGWDITNVQPAGNVDWVRARREALGRQTGSSQRLGQIYDIHDVYCHYDIDDDGIEEDLRVDFDFTSRRPMKVSFNPYDCRPITRAVYQLRSHLFYGLGVLRMLKPFQDEISDLHNYQTLNALLANCRVWLGTDGVIPETLRIWPGKVVQARSKDDLTPLQMADVYSSLFQTQFAILQLAEKRVGVNELMQPGMNSLQGNRTPGITALSVMQQVNKRFTPAFDGIREAFAEALKQCVYRYQEQLLADNRRVETHIIDVLGQEDGRIVVDTLRDESFDEHVVVELTASSASINREADRQNAFLLTQILSMYYQRTLEITALAANPQTPEPVRKVAVKIMSAASEIIDRTIRTFDQVRDPATFIIQFEGELNQAAQAGPADQPGLQQLLQVLMGQGGVPSPQPLDLMQGGQ